MAAAVVSVAVAAVVSIAVVPAPPPRSSSSWVLVLSSVVLSFLIGIAWVSSPLGVADIGAGWARTCARAGRGRGGAVSCTHSRCCMDLNLCRVNCCRSEPCCAQPSCADPGRVDPVARTRPAVVCCVRPGAVQRARSGTPRAGGIPFPGICSLHSCKMFLIHAATCVPCPRYIHKIKSGGAKLCASN